MSLKTLARDLYRVSKELEDLEKEFQNAQGPKKDELMERIFFLRQEKERLKKILEGHKTPPPYRMPR